MKDGSIYLLCGLSLIVISSFMFYSSFHTIDLSYNIIRLEKAYTLPNMYDYTLGGQIVDYELAYTNATATVFFSYFSSLLGMFLLGLGFSKCKYYKKGKVHR
jgi:hypothetical protein